MLFWFIFNQVDSKILLSSSGPWICFWGSHSESHLPITLWKPRCEGLWSQRVENILLHLVSVSLPSITTLPLREFPFQSVLFRLLLTHSLSSIPSLCWGEEAANTASRGKLRNQCLEWTWTWTLKHTFLLDLFSSPGRTSHSFAPSLPVLLPQRSNSLEPQ